MRTEIKKISVDALTPGLVLQESVGPNRNIPAGTILDAKKIKMIGDFGVQEVKVIETTDELVRGKKVESISQEITERIEGILGKEKGTFKKPGSLKAEDYIPKQRKEAKEILGHIDKSREDILTIEGGERVSIKHINNEINVNIRNLEQILQTVIIEKKVDLLQLKHIVNELIDITGPKKEASFLLLGIIRKGANIIIKHAVNTLLISLATAIELSKVMTSKLSKPEVVGDFKKLQICNAKIFNREELVKLGISAILHDIGLVDLFPEIREDTVLTFKDQSKIELHPSRAFTFLSFRNMDFDIRKAVLQHHEFIDGSGYPDGIERRLFSKYSIVLSFANYYDLKTTRNPFMNKLHPQKALMEIIQKEREKFDDDVIFAFCTVASLFPIGSWVCLSDDRIGLVVKSNYNNLRKPIVKVIYTPEMKELTVKNVVNLEEENLSVKELIEVESIEIFDKRYERFIFDEREFARIDVTIPAQMRISNSNVTVNGLITNLSAGGLSIKSAFNISKGEHVLLEFDFEKLHFENGFGLIVWKKALDKINFFYGIRFHQIKPNEHKYLFHEINRFLQD